MSPDLIKIHRGSFGVTAHNHKIALNRYDVKVLSLDRDNEEAKEALERME